MTIMTRFLLIGKPATQSAVMKGIDVTARKWPNTWEPAMRRSTMQAVRRDSSKAFISFPKGNPLVNASISTAAVPMLPASVGENQPSIIPPITTKKITPTQKKSGDDLMRSAHDDLGARWATVGSILTQP